MGDDATFEGAPGPRPRSVGAGASSPASPEPRNGSPQPASLAPLPTWYSAAVPTLIAVLAAVIAVAGR